LSTHVWIPDPQVRPGVPTAHLEWAAELICDLKPDRVIVAGDWWDMKSLSLHDDPGSAAMRDADLDADFEAGNQAFRGFDGRIARASRGKWKPSKDFLFGNHENRAARAAERDPRLAATYADHHFDTCSFRRHAFLVPVVRDGVYYSHYFQNMLSPHAIGGSIDNRLNKIGDSFVVGHEQGYKYGNRTYPTGRTRHGVVAGSFYIHDEAYKGAQGNNHWRGLVVLQEVRDGDFSVVRYSIDALCRRYEGMPISDYLAKRFKHAERLYSLARG
jgi:hypothetical protein